MCRTGIPLACGAVWMVAVLSAGAADRQLPIAAPVPSTAAKPWHPYPPIPVRRYPAPASTDEQPLPLVAWATHPAVDRRGDEAADSRVVYEPVDETGPLLTSPVAPDPGQAGNEGASGGVGQPWQWHVLPQGLLYHSYLAGGREPRFGTQIYYQRRDGWMLDATVGARVGVVRYGTDDVLRPEGWELDAEAAAFPRLTFDEYRDLVSVDFRYGFPLTYRRGPLGVKFAFYHLSSHLADEYMLSGQPFDRLNFVRDALVLGIAFWPTQALRLYAEPGWAFHVDGGSQPWQFQFGADFSPPCPTGFHGAPFLAVNGRLRQEVDFGGGFTLQTGWSWRSRRGQLLRFGFHYFNGQSEQCQFYTQHEQQLGLGLWYDF
jgi:hypothetical protein